MIDTEKEEHPTLDANYYKGHSNQRRMIQVVGTLETDGWEKRHEQIRRVHGIDGISPTIPTGTGGGVMTKVAIPVLTPDRKKKRQNGRRLKENGDPSFTLTGQDIHGVAVYDDYNHRMRTDGNVGSVRPTFNNEAAGNGNKLVDGVRIRRLTPTECERLQGFPDWWTEGISDKQRYKCLGNAVTTNVVYEVAKRLII